MINKLFLLFLLVGFYKVLSSFKIDPAVDIETFGYGVSQFHMVPKTWYTMWSYQGSGVMQYFWLTGGNFDVNSMLWEIYIDGALSPTYEFTADEFACIGFEDSASPWGTEMVGKGAKSGGIYSHLKIPFTTSIEYRASMTPNATTAGTLYWQVRGTPNLPIVIAGFELPPTAKLILYKNQNVVIQPLDFLTLANTNSAGVIFMTLFEVTSSNLNYLEGCFRSYTRGSAVPTLISTGSEDYFQSGYYFNAGSFHFPGAGLSHKNDTAGTLSAYKIHQYDPLFYGKGGFRFAWRNGDTQDPITNHKCANDNGSKVLNPQQSTVTTYVWTYEW